MKKFLFSLVFSSLIMIPFLVFAADPISPERLVDMLRTFLGWFRTAFLILAVIFLLYAGTLFFIASGEPDKVTRARRMLTYALIGIVIGLGADILIRIMKYIAHMPEPAV